jgi:uncharacterized protein YqeY
VVDVDRLRADLLVARKQRDKVAEVAIKRALALFENAAAPPAQARANIPGAASSAPTEVARIELTDGDRTSLIEAELAEAALAARQYEDGGHPDAAERLRAESAVLERYLT